MLLLVTALLLAQPQDDTDREVKRLKRRLELTDDQETKVREILKKEADAKKETRDRIREVLTDEQKEKFDSTRGDTQGAFKRLDDLRGQFGDLGGAWGLGSTGKQLQKELSLTDEQVKKIDDIAKEHYGDPSKWAEGFQDGKFDLKEWQKKQEESHKALGEKIKPVLTDEQRTKFDEAWAKRSWGRATVSGGDAPRADGPRGDRIKRAMEALKIESADDAAAVRGQLENVVKLQKELAEHGDKTAKRVRELARDESATEESVGKELEALREARRAIEKNLAAAQKDLREIVSYKQELTLIELGFLK